MHDRWRQFSRWLGRTPVQTFVLCPLAVLAFEMTRHDGCLFVVPWGCALLVWGYLQYRLVGRYRGPRAGGGPGIEVLPNRILAIGPYRYTRNPMYLAHLVFMTGLALTLWSWFALVLLAARAIWFHCQVLRDERHLDQRFGGEYAIYRQQVRRWIPGVI